MYYLEIGRPKSLAPGVGAAQAGCQGGPDPGNGGGSRNPEARETKGIFCRVAAKTVENGLCSKKEFKRQIFIRK